MQFVARPPRPPLDALVSLVWHATRAEAPAWETVLPTGRPQLVVQLDGRANRWAVAGSPQSGAAACVGGPFVGPLELPAESQAAVAGALFHPGGLAAMVDTPLQELRGAYVDVLDLWGRPALRWVEAVHGAPTPHAALDALEQGLAGHARRTSRRRALGRACTALAQGRSVRDVADLLGASQRRFSQTFMAEVGLTPKQFTRLTRFRRAVEAIRAAPHADLTDVALDAGFYDQAHLSREFRTFGGLTPGRFRESVGPYLNHVL